MQDSKTLIKRLNKDLSELNFGKEPQNLYDPIYYSINVGGKRTRPLLCLMACELFDGTYKDSINAAFGIEIFHNFTLLHDDMMDKASVRRGKPVVHVKWNENIALLSGDAMSVIAYKYICKSKINLREIIEVFSKTALEICEGQQYDMNFETTTNVNVEQYLKMIKLKTAVLLAASLKIGAITANATKINTEHIYSFGENLGMAFQLQDDFLDTFGTQEIFGKEIGGDIIANKKTYLLIKALELANEEQQKRLNYWMSNKHFNPKEKITAVKNIYKELNVHKHSENLINKYFKTAFNSFDKLEVAPSKKEVLYNYALSLKQRDF